MADIFYQFARKFRPDLDTLTGQRRLGGVADVISLFYSLPLLAIGFVWLVRVSTWQMVRQNWQLVLLWGGLLILFNRFSFYIITEIRSGGYANSQGALDSIVLWSGLLILGPVVIWLDVLWNVGNFLFNWRSVTTVSAAWSRIRVLVITCAGNVLSYLVGWWVYLQLGGEVPLRGLVLDQIVPALAGMAVQSLVVVGVYGGYIGYVVWGLKNVMHSSPRRAVNFFVLALALPALANPFGILAAGLYIKDGIGILLFDMAGLLLVALLARRLSQVAESTRQQSRQLEELEKLGRAIINAPPDASTLSEILKTHVPAMFASRGIAIWTASSGLLLHEPSDWALEIDPVWKFLQGSGATRMILPDERLPWQEKSGAHDPLLLVPIQNADSGETEGFVYLELQTLAVPWDKRSLASLVPAVQSLSAHVASACQQARAYMEMLAVQKTIQELSLARRIQDSFLPEHIPQIHGWQIAAALEPARQMAGDYYDFIQLPDGRLGILIADVADKGLGSALYMALSRTLIRTYAAQYTAQPAQVLARVNQRILEDARANLFVTVFYGVLDPTTGQLIYANAGHPPPYLMTAATGIHMLRNTGMPLGIDEESTWGQEAVEMVSEDVLLLYSDGVTDAQDGQGEFIDRKLILDVVSDCPGKPADLIRRDILEVVHDFVGEAARFDDITLVVLSRD